MRYNYSIKYRTSISLYYYGERYYDPRTSIWLSVDPLGLKNPNMSSYHYCSNNPLNMVDPDGKDDFFNEKGFYTHSTKVGSKIRVKMGDGYVLLSDIDLSSTSNRQIVANTLGCYVNEIGASYYAKGMVPVGNDPKGTVGLSSYTGDSEHALAFADKNYNIFLNRDFGKLDELLNDKHNMINTFVHEAKHKDQFLSNSTLKTENREIEAIQAQMDHSSYSKTTKEYQLNTLQY
ncbi:RHS repeat-associated core domain-containing protein [Dysgonomonas sp. GY617]|uniref:RHS repeat-associated core domain-containing protein n=1 Tax=Dysgonomonas sp. GY617 TaxID=2780420 RepID=UPI0018833F4F|nr:RHS repeat-associated core domain-containing protein [Dysgonomonas sp. GY617]MBF0575570.1 hypothetical protein [Dysgonomonas sp. GY617]